MPGANKKRWGNSDGGKIHHLLGGRGMCAKLPASGEAPPATGVPCLDAAGREKKIVGEGRLRRLLLRRQTVLIGVFLVAVGALVYHAANSTCETVPLRGFPALIAAIADDWGKQEITPLPERTRTAELEAWKRIENDRISNSPPPATAPRGHGQGKSETARIVLLGLDGVSWKVLRPLLAANVMPNLAALLQKSSYGSLASDYANSPISWTTIATGKHVAKTLITLDGEALWANQSPAVLAKRMWDLFAATDGRDLAIVDYFFTPRGNEFPEAILYQGRPRIRHPRSLFSNPFSSWRWQDPLGVATNVLKKTDRKVSASIVRRTDSLQHVCLPFYLQRYAPGFRKMRVLDRGLNHAHDDQVDELVRLFERLDRLFAMLRQEYANDYVFVVSDHGFHSEPPLVEVEMSEALLRDCGLPGLPKSRKGSMNWTWHGRDFVVSWSPEQWGSPLFGTAESLVPVFHFAVTTRNICFRAARPDEAATADLYRHLKSVADTWNGIWVKAFTVSRQGSEVWLRVSPAALSLARRFDGPEDQRALYFRHIGNDHRPGDPGIIIASGPGIAANRVIAGAALADIVPTLLYLRGRPVGADMDGRVLTMMIDPKRLADRPITKIPTYDNNAFRAGRNVEVHSLDPETRSRLRALGYLND